MQRRTFIWMMGAAAGAAYAADPQQEIFDLFTKIAGALSDDDPEMFVEAVDPNMPHFIDFRNDIASLAAQASLTNSIEVLSDKGDNTHRTEELDWFLEIVNNAPSHTVERRRAVLKFGLERKGKKWKIVSIEPLHFFAPPAN
ncbi:MAG TPA: hypothetical protein VMU80_13570 [Bryobacteraceae bacterium]|nr:hypothetical protein [Bryobacteraceae bacterium]